MDYLREVCLTLDRADEFADAGRRTVAAARICESAALRVTRAEASDAGGLPCSRSAQNYYRELNKQRQSEISVIKFLNTISPLSAPLAAFFKGLVGVGWERNLTLASLGGLAGEQPVPASSGVKDIVHLKRLVDLAEPLDPVRRATPSAFIERQLDHH